jgi:CRISPR-associated exonuclease Cas4
MTDPLPISYINHYRYCPRRFWLVHAEDSMEIDAQVLEGIIYHSTVHMQKFKNTQLTALPVIADSLNMIGVIDVAEPLPDGTFRLVEHKRGSTRQWANDQLQIVAQAIGFEETTGHKASVGSVFSWTSRRRYEFPITEELKTEVGQTVRAMHQVLSHGHRPPPTRETHKCPKCSLFDLCQPRLVKHINQGKKP